MQIIINQEVLEIPSLNYKQSDYIVVDKKLVDKIKLYNSNISEIVKEESRVRHILGHLNEIHSTNEAYTSDMIAILFRQ